MLPALPGTGGEGGKRQYRGVVLILLGLAGGAILAGWIIGRLHALALTIVIPLISVASRMSYEHAHGTPPELWTVNTVIFSAGFAFCVGAGVLLRSLTRLHPFAER